MSFLKSPSAGVNNQAPIYTGVQLGTSVNTLPVPIVYGRIRIAANCIDSEDFTKTTQKVSGGKFGGGSGGTQYDYHATIMMGLCEGPIEGVAQVWVGQTIEQLSDVGFSLFTGTTPQAPWGYMSSAHPDKALGYQATAYVAAANYDLGSGAQLPNHNFEVLGPLIGTGYFPNGPSGDDADPAQCILDFLTNGQYGVGFPASSIDMGTLLSSGDAAGGGDAALQTYVRAIGVAFSVALVSQETASSVLTRWSQLTNCAAVWSGTALKFIPYGDELVAANGVVFKPDVTPIYDLSDDDYVAADDGGDPVQIQRSDIADCDNVVRVEISDRSNQYNDLPIEARDESMVNRYTLRVGSTVSGHEICDSGAASVVAQLILQRGLYIRNQYSFTLSWEYCLLEPMDLVTLTDTALGLNKVPVRILSIEEDDQGMLSVTAEEFPSGLATATSYPKQARTPYQIQYNAKAAPVNPPVIFEPPPSLTGGDAQVWIAASGGNNGVADPYWGGCNVYLSSDGVEFLPFGTISRPARMGVLTAALPAPATGPNGADPDTANTLAVSLAESGGMLLDATDADADAGRTLCFVDGELLAYGRATLTDSGYNLTYLRRGLYGTTPSEHLAGAGFVRLDDAVFKLDLPAQDVGAALHVKLESFNVFGGGVQDLADCFAYGLTPQGVGYFVNPPSNVLVTSNARTQSDGSHLLTLVLSWNPSSGPLLGQYEVQYQVQGDPDWHSVMTGAAVTSYAIVGAQADVTYNARVRAVSTVGNVSAFASAAPTASGSLTDTVPSMPAGFSAVGGQGLVQLSWLPNPEPDIQWYRLFAAQGGEAVFSDAALIAQVQATAFAYVNLPYGTDYSFWLEAVNAAGPSSPAGPIHAVTSFTIEIPQGVISQSMLAPQLEQKIAGVDPSIFDQINAAASGIQQGAAVKLERETREDADGNLAKQIFDLTASLDNTNAQLVIVQETLADGTSALAQQVTALQATVATDNDTLTAAIETEQTARADGDSANATAIQTVQATVDGHTASIAEQSTAIAGIDGTLTATWSLKTQAVGTHTAIAGIGVEADGGTGISEVAIMASRFIVIDVDPATGNPVAVSPFFIQNGNVYSQALYSGSISASQITGGTISGQTLNVFGNLNYFDNSGNLVFNGAGIQKLIDGTASRTYGQKQQNVALPSQIGNSLPFPINMMSMTWNQVGSRALLIVSLAPLNMNGTDPDTAVYAWGIYVDGTEVTTQGETIYIDLIANAGEHTVSVQGWSYAESSNGFPFFPRINFVVIDQIA